MVQSLKTNSIQKRCISFVCATAITSSVYAGTSLDDILSSTSGGFDYAGPSSIKTQTRGYYNFGGLSVRSDIGGSIRPFNIQMPRLASGCGGVDIGFGGFSFLNIDQLVEKLQKIASAAPAFAFNMALSALCKDCQSIMDQLNAVADSINGLNFDACKSAVGWGKSIGSAMNGKLNFQDDAKSGIEDVIKNTSSAITNWASNLQSVINCGPSGECTDTSPESAKQKAIEKERFQGSFLHKIFTDNSSFLSAVEQGSDSGSTYSYWFKGIKKDDAEALFRNMIGDFYGYVEEDNCAGSDTEGGIKAYDLAVVVPQMSSDEVVKIFLGADNGTDMKLKGTFITKETKVCNNKFYGKPEIPDPQELSTSFNAASIHTLVKTKIKEILINIQQSNNAEVKNSAKMLSAFRFPVYKALNVASITNDTLLVDYIADVIVSQELVGLINELVKKQRRMVTLGTISEATKKIVNESGAIAEMEKRIVEINKMADSAYQTSLEKMNSRVAQISVLEDTTKRLKNELTRKGIYRISK